MMDKLNSDVAYRELPGYSRRTTLAYYAFIVTSWTLSVAASIYYAVLPPNGIQVTPIWDQNYLHPTTFTMDSIVGTLYWINLFAGQLLCIGFATVVGKAVFKDAILSTGNHFIAFNLLHIGSVILFVFSYFEWAQVILVLNFANMSALYFRHHYYPLPIHSYLVSGPLSWTFFALYWNGFCIAPYSEVAQIVGSVFIWGILGYGLFFAFAYKDSTMCFFLSFLGASVAVYHAIAKSGPQLFVPPAVITAALLGAVMTINISRWTNKKHGNQIRQGDNENGAEPATHRQANIIP